MDKVGSTVQHRIDNPVGIRSNECYTWKRSRKASHAPVADPASHSREHAVGDIFSIIPFSYLVHRQNVKNWFIVRLVSTAWNYNSKTGTRLVDHALSGCFGPGLCGQVIMIDRVIVIVFCNCVRSYHGLVGQKSLIPCLCAQSSRTTWIHGRI
jgi:hypothetical protein